MPKAYSEPGKERIRRTLLQKGREYFIRYGIKKTSVEELTRAAGIAKGSFYKFFDSKEALFMAVHEESEAKLQQDMFRKLEGIRDPAERIRAFLKNSFLLLEEDPLLRMVFGTDDLASLAGFMSTEQFGEHYRRDLSFLGEMLAGWQAEGTVRKDLDIDVAANMLASIYYIVLRKESIGRDMYDKVTDMIIDCLSGYFAATEQQNG